MKLREKHRENSRVHRIHDPAQTPFQRLRASTVLSPDMLAKLSSIHQAIDPVRLLKQIETLQDALWRHAVHPPPAKNVDSADKAEVRFESLLNLSGETEQPSLSLDGVLKPETNENIEEHRNQKPQGGGELGPIHSNLSGMTCDLDWSRARSGQLNRSCEIFRNFIPVSTKTLIFGLCSAVFNPGEPRPSSLLTTIGFMETEEPLRHCPKNSGEKR